MALSVAEIFVHPPPFETPTRMFVLEEGYSVLLNNVPLPPHYPFRVFCPWGGGGHF